MTSMMRRRRPCAYRPPVRNLRPSFLQAVQVRGGAAECSPPSALLCEIATRCRVSTGAAGERLWPRSLGGIAGKRRGRCGGHYQEGFLVSHQLRSRVVGCLLAVAVGAIAFAPTAN